MLQLPEYLQVRVTQRGYGIPIGGIAVVLDARIDGRFYYGDLIGLTDASGVVRRSAEELRLDFAADQRAFPMDYRVPLENCDPDLVIAIEGVDLFERKRSELLQSAVVLASVKQLYRIAANAAWNATEQIVRTRPEATPIRIEFELDPRSAAGTA